MRIPIQALKVIRGCIDTHERVSHILLPLSSLAEADSGLSLWGRVLRLRLSEAGPSVSVSADSSDCKMQFARLFVANFLQKAHVLVFVKSVSVLCTVLYMSMFVHATCFISLIRGLRSQASGLFDFCRTGLNRQKLAETKNGHILLEIHVLLA